LAFDLLVLLSALRLISRAMQQFSCFLDLVFVSYILEVILIAYIQEKTSFGRDIWYYSKFAVKTLLRAGGMLDILAAVSRREDPGGYVLGISYVDGYHRCRYGDPFGLGCGVEGPRMQRTAFALSTATAVSLQSSFLLPLSLHLSHHLSLSA